LPDVHLKFYTASEIHHISRLEGCSHEEVLRTLKDAGLDSMPGGGAEIFADRVRALVAPGKEHPDEGFEVHDTAHKLGITTQCTMLYGHVETYEERVDHLLRLREQQDRTNGFLSFIPLAFHPENTVFERRGFRFTTGADDLKVIAVSRLLLGRIAYVNMAPVFYRVAAEVEEVQGVPTELNRMLVAGGLDTAPISSIAYATEAARLRLLPRLCVASEGAVDSIQLVTRVPL